MEDEVRLILHVEGRQIGIYRNQGGWSTDQDNGWALVTVLQDDLPVPGGVPGHAPLRRGVSVKGGLRGFSSTPGAETKNGPEPG